MNINMNEGVRVETRSKRYLDNARTIILEERSTISLLENGDANHLECNIRKFGIQFEEMFMNSLQIATIEHVAKRTSILPIC